MVISEFKKNANEVVRISLTEFKGHKLLDIRVFYDVSENQDPDRRPSKKGISLSVDLFEDLKEGIEKAGKAIEKNQRKPGGASQKPQAGKTQER